MTTPAQGRVTQMARTVAMLCAASAAGCVGGAKAPAADLIIRNARVWTVDPAKPEAQALAVRGDHLVAVGSSDDIAALAGAATRTIDAQGRFVMPGFNDAHLHLMTGGMQLDNVDLRDATSPEEFAHRIGERARAMQPGDWITGGDWDEQRWQQPALPTKDLVDPLTPSTPVFVNRYDEHMALANSAALRLAGITAATPDPPGGVIVRDAKGNPTGILKDAAMAAVYTVVPPLSLARRELALRHALEHMASLGVTSVQDMGPTEDDIELYKTFASRGELKARIRAVSPAMRLAQRLAAGRSPAFVSPLVRVAGAKTFADGSLGSTTAFLFEPYTDAPTSRGLLAEEMHPLEGMRARLVAIDKAGEQLCVHAIGDRAISIVLDLYQDVQAANGPRDRRPRIEHAQHMAPADFARYARLGVIASVQPYHAIDDGKWAERRIGAERAKTTYAFRTFLDHKVRLAFGTDWPVAPLDPMLGLYAAVTRATLDGKRPGGWVPEQKINLADAIEAYTLGAARAEFQEHEKGSLTPGKFADLVMLAADPFQVAPEALRDVKVAMTVMGGKVVYER